MTTKIENALMFRKGDWMTAITDAEGEYKANILFLEHEGQKLVRQLEAMIDAFGDDRTEEPCASAMRLVAEYYRMR